MARILLVTNDYPPDNGGIQSYLAGLVEHTEHSVRVVAPHSDVAADHPGVVRRVSKRFMWPTARMRAWVEGQVLEFQAEFVLFGAPHPLAFMGPGLRRRLGIRYGVITHGAEVALGRLVPGFSQLLRRSLSKADVVYSVSGFTKQLVERVSGRDVIRLGVGFTQPPVQNVEVEAAFTVLCVSRFVPRKQQLLLITAVEQMKATGPPVHLRIIGSGPDAVKLANRAGESLADVEVVATDSRQTVLDAFAAASAFAMPCKDRWFGREFEGLGIVFLEAAAAGLPVIAGQSGGAPETVLPGVSGFVTSNLSQLVEGLEWLRAHPAEASQMGKVGKSFVREEFNWMRVSARFDRSIRQVLTSTGSKSL